MVEQKLHFKIKVDEPLKVHEKFFPGGKRLLNRTPWRAKEPGTCAITNLHVPNIGRIPPYDCFVEVTYRPPGFVSYLGDTKYVGWTMMMPNRAPDGTYLDEPGKPLEQGKPIVELPFEVYGDIDFNEITFGEYLETTDSSGVKSVTYNEVIQEIDATARKLPDPGPPLVEMSSAVNFAAARVNRPLTKVILTNAPTQQAVGQSGHRVINLNNATPNLERQIEEQLTQLMFDFMEGKVDITNTAVSHDGAYDMIFVKLSDALIESTPNEEGMDSWFNRLNYYVSANFMENLAKKLMAIYRVEANVVTDPKNAGFVIRPLKPKWGER